MKDGIKVGMVLGTLALNVFLIYLLLYGPFDKMLAEQERLTNISTSSLIDIVTFTLIGLIILTSIFLGIKIYKEQKVFIYAPLLSLLILVAIFVVSHL